MNPTTFMLIAGEASGDLLAAELVRALREEFQNGPPNYSRDTQPLRADLAPRFFGAGGTQMAAAGVEIVADLTAHSLIGLSEAAKKYFVLREIFDRLVKIACDREPDVIVCVDFSGFNLRFARAIRQRVRARQNAFNNWRPKIVQYVSPQVWASRPGRAWSLAGNVDLLLSIIPFEKDWYAKRVPKLPVEFVGHPIVDRSQKSEVRSQKTNSAPSILLLPGSRADEVRRHLPLLAETARRIKASLNVQFKMILPNAALSEQAKSLSRELSEIELCVGGLAESLARSDLAITKSGTVTLECALFGVPAVVFYKTSWPTYLAGRMLVNVNYLAMPNLLAGEEIYPEFVQGAATAENLSRAALESLNNTERQASVKAKLAQVVKSLGEPGASERAAKAVMRLL